MTATKTISLVLIGSALVFAGWSCAPATEDEDEKHRHAGGGGFHGGGYHAPFWHTSSGTRSGPAGTVSGRGGFGHTGSGAGT